ncbi:MAG: PKD domain-containing protein [Bacteroidales bacterium]
MKTRIQFLMFAVAVLLMAGFQSCKKDDPDTAASTIADFEFALDNDGFAPCVATFSDKSINATGYSWDFGNGKTSTEANPSTTYTTPGVYEVTLTVTPKETLHYNKLVKTATVVIKDPQAGTVQTLYFTDRTTHNVRYVALDGNTPLIQEFSHTGLNKPYGMVIDTVSSKVYVTDYATNIIYSYNLDGSDLTTIANQSNNQYINTPTGIFIWDNKLYWSQEGGIYRCNLDGTSPEPWILTPITTAPEWPIHMAFDPASQMIYFTNDKLDYSGGVYKVNLNGSGMTQLVSGTDGGAIGLDLAGGKMYYADYEKGMCMANLDGTGEVVINSNLKNIYVWGLIVNTAEGKLYWADKTNKVIGRSNLDGSNPEDFLTNVNPHAMALDKFR